MPDPVPAQPAVDPDRVHAPDRERAELHRQGQHEDQAQPELRNGVPGDADHADDVVLDPAAAKGREDAERHADEHRDDERDHRDLQAVGDAFDDDVQHRTIEVERVPEVEMRYLPEPGQELDGQRLVEAERVPKRLAVLWSHVVLAGEHELQRIRRRKPTKKECKKKDPEEGRDRLNEATGDEATQKAPPIHEAPERQNAARAPRSLRDYFLSHHFSTFHISEYVLGSQACSFWSPDVSCSGGIRDLP